MKTTIAILLVMTSCTGFFTTGCVTSHTESDHRTLLGGYKHEETTTTRNPITGNTTVTHKEQKYE